MICNSYDNFFENFSNKTRIKIIDSLKKGSKSVNQICTDIHEEQSKVSHNLKRLTDCHFLDVERNGKQRIYSLNKDTIMPLLNMVSAHVKKYCCEVCTK